MKKLTHILRSQRGYTLIELIVSMMIFAVILVIAVGAFISVSNSSLKAGAQRRVQQEIRFNLEEIVRQTRASQIDYAFYRQAGTDTRCTVAGGQTLALIYTESERGDIPENHRLFFYIQNNSLYKYDLGPRSDVLPTPGCAAMVAAAAVPANKLNADSVQIVAGSFTVTPNTDPYDASAPAVVSSVHPRVTISVTVRTGSIGGERQTANYNELTMQTSVSSRSYPIDTLYGQSGAPVDNDNDGVTDPPDDCPTVPGPAPTGCPDADSDGLPDNLDACPNLAGSALAGCPRGSATLQVNTRQIGGPCDAFARNVTVRLRKNGVLIGTDRSGGQARAVFSNLPAGSDYSIEMGQMEPTCGSQFTNITLTDGQTTTVTAVGDDS